MNPHTNSKPQIQNEEFSIEFGDVNGIKLYELPFMSQKKKTRNINNQEKESRRL